jgi:hypothetical protein
MVKYCRICGKPDCKEHLFSFKNIKIITEFSGSSPPEIFVGRHNYPNVNIGILSPQEKGNTEILSSQEIWHKQRLSMPEIISLRNKLIYSRTKGNVKRAIQPNTSNINDKNFLRTMQEVSMSSKSISAEFKLLKPISANKEKDSYIPIIANSAQVKSVRLEENPIIEKKIDYLVNDTDARAKDSILELNKSKISVQSIIKILSAGLLGKKLTRKLIPTRWAITSVDDTISKEKLKKIKYYQEISDFLVFHSEYLGNNYNFLLLPDKFSFEVIEINQDNPELSWHDYESFFPRKTYAESVTGAYYANRLALSEYLEKIQKQCSCIVFREINPEIYTQSMGVGILREISRDALNKQPQVFSTLNEALLEVQSRLRLNIKTFTDKSIILKNYKKQARLERWL